MGRAADIGIRISRDMGVTEGVARITRRVPRSVLSVADQIVASATTFATGALIGRACAKEEFGLYAIAFSLLTLLMTVQSSLIATPFMVRAPRLEGEDARRFAGSSLAHQGVFAVSMSALAVVSGLLVLYSDAALGQTLCAIGAALVFLLFRDYVRQVCFARLAYTRALLLDGSLAAAQACGLAALYVTGTLYAWSAFLVLGAACATSGAQWLVLTHGERTMSRADVASDWAESWRTGKWLLASGLVWAVSMNLYPWIVAGFHGTATAAAWAAALGVMTLINPLMLGVQNYIGPRIMHARATGGVAHLRRTVRNAAAGFGALLLFFTAAMVFAGDPLVVAIYGAKYAGNGALVVLLSLNAAVLTSGFAISRGLFALDLARVDFFVNLTAFACFVVFGVALVRWAGPIGAALGQIIANTIATGIRAFALARGAREAERAAA